MDKHEFKKLLADDADGKLEAGDRQRLQRWYDSFGESEEDIPSLRDEETAARLREEMLAGIQSRLTLSGSEKIRRPWRRMSFAAAAVFVLLIGSYFMFADQLKNRPEQVSGESISYYEVHTGARQIKKITLPDYTTLHVNAHSRLRIPEVFDKSHRTIYLDEGEAFFEVAADSTRPFIVETAHLGIQVLGTSFNVKSYETLEDEAVAVHSGIVQVRDSAGVIAKLHATEGVTYNKAKGIVRLEPIDPRRAATWMTGVVHLEKASFSEVAQIVRNLHGIGLSAMDSRINNYRYNITLRADRTLEENLKIICAIHKNNYRRTKDEIVIYP